MFRISAGQVLRLGEQQEEIRIGVEAVKETLTANYFRHDEANKAQAMVEERPASVYRQSGGSLLGRRKQILGFHGSLRLHQNPYS